MTLEPGSDSQKKVVRSAFSFLSGTFLSRISGLGRDTAMAFFFGSHPAVAAFMVAFRFANFIRRLFGEGAISSGFIPHFEGMRRESLRQGALFFRDVNLTLALFLTLLIALIEVGLIGMIKWGGLSPGNVQILQFAALMMPGILFICLFGLTSGFLQCQGRYFVTGLAPVAFNLVWIGATFCLQGEDPTLAMFFLSSAVVLAFFMQWMMLFPIAWSFIKPHLSWKEWFCPQIFIRKGVHNLLFEQGERGRQIEDRIHSIQSRLQSSIFGALIRSTRKLFTPFGINPELVQVIRPLLFSAMGVAAVQINSTLDVIFARCSTLEGPAYLWYAIRIEQVPLALFGIALSTALLPPLSRAIKSGDTFEYLQLLQFSFRRTFGLMIPSTFAMFVLGLSGVNLLYGHGNFSQEATIQTTLCLWGYGLGLIPSVLILLLAPAFYATKEYRIPMMGSIYSVIMNTGLTVIFIFYFHLGAVSIAIATSLAAWFNYFYLSHQLSKKLGGSLLSLKVGKSVFKVIGSSLAAVGVTLCFGQLVVKDMTIPLFFSDPSITLSREFTAQLIQFLLLIGVFLLTLVGCARVIKAEAINELYGFVA